MGGQAIGLVPVKALRRSGVKARSHFIRWVLAVVGALVDALICFPCLTCSTNYRLHVVLLGQQDYQPDLVGDQPGSADVCPQGVPGTVPTLAPTRPEPWASPELSSVGNAGQEGRALKRTVGQFLTAPGRVTVMLAAGLTQGTVAH